MAMYLCKKVTVLYGVLCLAIPSIASAATWEELYSSASADVEAKIEMRKTSFKKRQKHGETIVNAHLRTYYREGKEIASATGDYEMHCAARKAYRSNLKMETLSADNTRGAVSVPNKMMIEGTEYQTLTGIMEVLCAK